MIKELPFWNAQHVDVDDFGPVAALVKWAAHEYS